MKFPIWCGLALVLLAGHAGAAPQNAPPSVPLVSTGACAGNTACPGVPNDPTHWFYGFDPTVNASVQALLTALGQPLTINLPSGIATSALQTAGNASLATLATASAWQATAAKQDTAQTSLTAIAASTAAGSTAAGQTTANTSLSTIATNSGTQATASLQTTGNTSAATTATNTGNTATSTASTATNTSTTATNTGTVATNTGAISTATGTQADAAYSGSGNSTIIAALKGIYARLGAVVLATGANIIGAVTQSGNWVLSAGSAIIGKVGIDQTTPGTTNKVSVGSDVVSVATANSASGTDHSLNAPSALTILATFTTTNPGAYRVQNQSANTIQVIMDNGTSGPTIILLAPGGGAGQQGADTSPEIPWFTGRIQVAGPTGSQFAARSN